MLELLLGSGQGCWVRARRAGRQEVLDADAPQQPKRPRRAVRSALLASGPDPQAASRLARVVSPLAFPAPRCLADHRCCLPRCGSAAGPLSWSSLATACSVMRLTSGRCRNRLADSVSSSYRGLPALAPSTYPAAPPAAMPRVPPHRLLRRPGRTRRAPWLIA